MTEPLLQSKHLFFGCGRKSEPFAFTNLCGESLIGGQPFVTPLLQELSPLRSSHSQQVREWSNACSFDFGTVKRVC